MPDVIDTGPWMGNSQEQSLLSDFAGKTNIVTGTWTPVFLGGTVVTYTSQIGYYFLLNRLATLVFYVSWSALSGATNISITNVPFKNSKFYPPGAVGGVIRGFYGKAILGSNFVRAAGLPINEGLSWVWRSRSNAPDTNFFSLVAQGQDNDVGAIVQSAAVAGSFAGQVSFLLKQRT